MNEHQANMTDKKPEQKKPTTPATEARCMDRGWRYTRSESTDVSRTRARYGWMPSPTLRRT